MKKLLFLLTLTAAVSCNTPQELAVMTLNMRYDNPEDGMNNWRFRRERIAGLIRSEAVDLLGTQEVLANQFDDLQALLPGYRAVGVGREDGARAGEFNAVFFRSDRFELLDSGVFWLSEEPETPGSKGWDGACERLATWTVLRDKSGRELLFINTHLDHVGEQARREGVALLLRRIETLRDGRPVILTAISTPNPRRRSSRTWWPTEPCAALGTRQPERHGTAWSFSDFGQLPEEERPLIDYVFCGGGLEVRSCSILPDTLGGGYLSDHAPVEARLKYVR